MDAQQCDIADHPTSTGPPNPSSTADNDAKQPEQLSATADLTPQSFQATAQQLTDQALRFLSSASNETLGACLVGLGATTYLVLGRVGLVLMGVAGGVVLHATWEAGSTDGKSREEEEWRRKQAGVDIVQQALDWRRKQHEALNTEGEEQVRVERHPGITLDFSSFQPETAAALNELTDAVIRDYVKWWYLPILPDEGVFPNSCQQTFAAFLLSLSGHLSRKRPADVFLDFLTNSSSILIVYIGELSSALSSAPVTTVPEAIASYVEQRPDSSLANVMDVEQQRKKLNLVAEDILEVFLEHKAYNCEPVRLFLQQVLAKLILEVTIQRCSKPEFFNGWIIYLLQDGEPEIMKEIDAGVDGLTAANPPPDTVAKVDPNIPNHTAQQSQHKRAMSRAQEAMDEAMREAQRLTQLIIEEDAKKAQGQASTPVETATEAAAKQQSGPPSTTLSDTSESTPQGVHTPSSSHSESAVDESVATQAASVSLEKATDDIPAAPFTSFDQILPQVPTAFREDSGKAKREIPPLTLYNALINIFDDSMPGDRTAIRSKPTTEYLIQVEPASSHHSGWMTARKLVDFENLHEILRRIAQVSGGQKFTEAHPAMPQWKGRTKNAFREDLERYLSDAVQHRPLAESDGLKRFLEKDTVAAKSSSSGKGGFTGLGWPAPSAFENAGKGMMDALAKAPTGIAGGGKALIGGVTGVLGNKSAKKGSSLSTSRSSISVDRPPLETRMSTSSISIKSVDGGNDSSPIVDTQPSLIPQMEKPPSIMEVEPESKSRDSPSNSKPTSIRESVEITAVLSGDQLINLPPPPSDITDDYTPEPTSRSQSLYEPETAPCVSTSTISTEPAVAPVLPAEPTPALPPVRKIVKPKAPLTEEEARVAVELLFAIINELYTMSSAWTLRRRLLLAAKTFLLRPGNPQLESIRQLLQASVLDANTSDAGVAGLLRQLRANTLPTEEELKAWPAESSAEEKEEMRVKARKLLVERGMPQALTSVMGTAASGEALGRVFDCLQTEQVVRGLVFGLVLQAARAVTQ
ncbi:hypothetical protein EJ06DRAFT_490811 [Trichodelitschia bisporula]|uniref:PXA domain-containing protein n=1 Tax=Trichodelitschia bisporula TaxID=703511 RepID=A0A6G1I2V9_9PEZI|nr:hypothetical protein EJ06DRAFT_490811 [Trichodelitschia bisporula]